MANEFRVIRKAIAQAVDAYLEEKKGVISWNAIYDIAAEAAQSAQQSVQADGWRCRDCDTMNADDFKACGGCGGTNRR